ncbi:MULTISPECIES: putative signal transducing protein [Shewanella]|uniref:DUF2007 domain-containing protein n=1 Tax=Shewanella marisflavi TaxID=260364 RepID=A0AAC9TYN6_9GAMM|nr:MULTISPECIES: DUF2007 domain-containing protein [Shewanella]ASJ96476.1 DUF2007 domain-containing protein [Shewanella marisflavi]MCL1041476.1 DUF2007 domain-containing protein [Shewanella marisflavi]QDF75004.1 DUF2007 domain-containing protein [Shewanella marisflavi]
MEERSKMVAGGNLLQAHAWKGMLEACGIGVELKGEALLGGIGELPVDLQDVELWVAESQYEAARAQLETLNSESPKWQCVKCHEMNEGNFELCWHCSAERSEQLS